VASSSFIKAQQFKSPLSVVAGFLLRSRETQAGRSRDRNKENQRLRRSLTQLEREQKRAREELSEAKREIEKLKAENARLRNQPPKLPDDPPLPHHSYGAKMISLCTNLARTVGLRRAVAALRLFFEWLGVESKVPDWTTIRSWLCRLGVAEIESPVAEADDWIWMADHSNQIGSEKVLAILGIRASELPERGQAIRHEDVRLLSIVPGVDWKREDVAREYTALAKRIGAPMALVVDGAVELRDSAESLKKLRKKVLVLHDFKHHAANVLKKIVGKDARFNDFHSEIGRTRSAIQQTELAHLTPPPQKPKSRFMNLAATLRWAEMVSWQLSNPNSQARRDVPTKRMNEKLGWLRSFRNDVQRWSQCQKVVSRALTFINEQGLFVGAAAELRKIIADLTVDDASRQVAEQLIQFVNDAESQLSPGMRLPMSTEILESTFGLYKQLEGQHNKGGFTTLLPAFGSLLRPSTPSRIAESFARLNVRQMRNWVADRLNQTLASKRQQAYRECATPKPP